MQWQSELKRRTRPGIVDGRHPSPMCLDDRAADRQSHAYAAGFGSEEGIEQPIRVLGGEPETAVLHCYQHLVCFVLMSKGYASFRYNAKVSEPSLCCSVPSRPASSPGG